MTTVRMTQIEARDAIIAGTAPASIEVIGGVLYIPGRTAITSLPELPAVTWLNVRGCTSLTSLPELPLVKSLYAAGCTGLTSLPEMPALTRIDVAGCTGLTCLYQCKRGYRLHASESGNRYYCECHSFTRDEAIAHWGSPEYRDRARGDAFVAAVRAYKGPRT